MSESRCPDCKILQETIDTYQETVLTYEQAIINYKKALQTQSLTVKDQAKQIKELKRVQPAWIKVEDRLPDTCRHVLARYYNCNNFKRTVVAQFIKRFTEEAVEDGCDHRELNSEYCEERDASFVKEGWYECLDNWEEYSSILIGEGVVVEWMELPV